MLEGEAIREALVCADPGVLEQDVRRTKGEYGAHSRDLLIGIPQVPGMVDKNTWCNSTSSSGHSPGYCRDTKDVAPNFEEVTILEEIRSLYKIIVTHRTYKISLFELEGILNHIV